MQDVIHAAIARDRVKELVETAGAERAARRPRRSAGKVQAQQVPATPSAGRRVTLRGLRPRLR